MNNQSIHMGIKLKELAYEKRAKTKDIAQKMNLTTQGVYNIYTRKSVGNDVLVKFCEALGIPTNSVMSAIYNNIDDMPINTVIDNSNYLQKYISELEQRITEQSKQIAEQSKQLAQQAQTIMSLVEKLGKSKASGLLAGADA